ncbi:hypothetical protein ACI3ER_11775 [Bacillus sp. Wb]
MSKAREVLLEIQRSVRELEKSSYNLKKDLSKVDRQINDVYHEIEVMELDKEKCFEMHIKLQKLLRQRREIKLEITYFKEANDQLQLDEDLRIKIHDARIHLQRKEKKDKEYAHWMKHNKTTETSAEA